MKRKDIFIVVLVIFVLFIYGTLNSGIKKYYIVTSKGDTAGVMTPVNGQVLLIACADTARWGMANQNMFYQYGITAGHILKMYDTVFTANTASGQSLDISYVGFTVPPIVLCSAERNTVLATSSPQIAVKSRSTSAITFNLTEGNANLVTVLGISVLGGAGTVFSAIPSTITIHVVAIGY